MSILQVSQNRAVRPGAVRAGDMWVTFHRHCAAEEGIGRLLLELQSWYWSACQGAWNSRLATALLISTFLGACALMTQRCSVQLMHTGRYDLSLPILGWRNPSEIRLIQPKGIVREPLTPVQARQLDKQLKGSERAVEAQTRTLRGELKRSRVAESTSKDPAFRKEVRMDEDLLNQAETETRRDKQLVRQAEREMKGDKKFLEDAYRRDTRSNDCPSTACRDARALGQTPRACTISAQGDCPRINCMDYQETGRCSAGRVCSRPSSRAEGCDYGGNGPVSWTRRQCPGASPV